MKIEKQIHVSRGTIGIFVFIISKLLCFIGFFAVAVSLLSSWSYKLTTKRRLRIDIQKKKTISIS